MSTKTNYGYLFTEADTDRYDSALQTAIALYNEADGKAESAIELKVKAIKGICKVPVEYIKDIGFKSHEDYCVKKLPSCARSTFFNCKKAMLFLDSKESFEELHSYGLSVTDTFKELPKIKYKDKGGNIHSIDCLNKLRILVDNGIWTGNGLDSLQTTICPKLPKPPKTEKTKKGSSDSSSKTEKAATTESKTTSMQDILSEIYTDIDEIIETDELTIPAKREWFANILALVYESIETLDFLENSDKPENSEEVEETEAAEAEDETEE